MQVDPILATPGLTNADLPHSRAAGDVGVSGSGAGEAHLAMGSGLLNPHLSQNSQHSSLEHPMPSGECKVFPSTSGPLILGGSF
jgi:hypothetical protein